MRMFLKALFCQRTFTPFEEWCLSKIKTCMPSEQASKLDDFALQLSNIQRLENGKEVNLFFSLRSEMRLIEQSGERLVARIVASLPDRIVGDLWCVDGIPFSLIFDSPPPTGDGRNANEVETRIFQNFGDNHLKSDGNGRVVLADDSLILTYEEFLVATRSGHTVTLHTPDRIILDDLIYCWEDCLPKDYLEFVSKFDSCRIGSWIFRGTELRIVVSKDTNFLVLAESVDTSSILITKVHQGPNLWLYNQNFETFSSFEDDGLFRVFLRKEIQEIA